MRTEGEAVDARAVSKQAGGSVVLDRIFRAERGARYSRVPLRIGGHVLFLGLTVVMVAPLVWMVLTSVRPADTVFAGPLIPRTFTGAAYSYLIDQSGIQQNFLNSFIVTSATVALVIGISCPAAYAFAKLPMSGRQLIFVLIISTLMVPAAAILIPQFLLLKGLGLLNQLIGLIIVYVATSLPFSVLLLRSFFQRIPDELREAARLDGASEGMVFLRVMVPLAVPGIASMVVFQSLFTWNELLYALTFISTPSRLTLQPVVYSLIGQYYTNWPALMAALTMCAVPIIMIYIIMQRQFVAGLTSAVLRG